MQQVPAVSIITPCLNRVSTIAAAVRSVEAQDGNHAIEHIVADGGSTDGTLELLRRYPSVQVFSEPDKNLYDGINKGLAHARGHIIGLLNADDAYLPGAVNGAVHTFERNPRAQMVSGSAVVTDFQGVTLVRHNRAANRSLHIRDLLLGVPIINARFFRRSLIEELKGFDIKYPIASDRDFLLRAMLAKALSVSVAEVCYEYRYHPNSLTIGGAQSRARIAQEHLGLAENWLHGSEALTDFDRNTFLQLHGHAIVTAVLLALRKGNMVQATELLRRGFALGPRWCMATVSVVTDKLRRRLF